MYMKKEIYLSVTVAVVLIAGVLLFTKRSSIPSPSTSVPVSQEPIGTQTTTKEVSQITTAAVSSHSSASNCWIILQNKAYNVTTYLSQHPGGSETIIPYCGKDATTAFNTIKDGRGHSPKAMENASQYYVGDVL